MLKGKYLSILGDSISTYKGISNDASANATLINNPYYYMKRVPLENTYWKIVMERLGLSLCVNNSFAGGNLSGRDDNTSGVNRVDHLSSDGGCDPDLVIVFMGINDLGRNVPLSVFTSDYESTLMSIKSRYPHAMVCCVALPDRDEVFKKRAEKYNASIKAAVENAGENFFVADLFHSRLNNDVYYMNTIDGLHPDADGMRMIADVVSDAIEKHVSGIHSPAPRI